MLHRFGMDDASTGSMLADLAGRGELPDFTVAYFADNDYESHEVGPVAALPVRRTRGPHARRGLRGRRRHRARSSRDTAVIVTSDHGHCDVLNDPAAVIRLDQLLADFRQADARQAVDSRRTRS